MALRVTSTVHEARQTKPRSSPLKYTSVKMLAELKINAIIDPISVLRATSRSLPLDGP